MELGQRSNTNTGVTHPDVQKNNHYPQTAHRWGPLVEKKACKRKYLKAWQRAGPSHPSTLPPRGLVLGDSQPTTRPQQAVSTRRNTGRAAGLSSRLSAPWLTAQGRSERHRSKGRKASHLVRRQVKPRAGRTQSTRPPARPASLPSTARPAPHNPDPLSRQRSPPVRRI